jgi:ABC-type phosphate/phosphonate transport system permease subunit
MSARADASAVSRKITADIMIMAVMRTASIIILAAALVIIFWCAAIPRVLHRNRDITLKGRRVREILSDHDEKPVRGFCNLCGKWRFRLHEGYCKNCEDT